MAVPNTGRQLTPDITIHAPVDAPLDTPLMEACKRIAQELDRVVCELVGIREVLTKQNKLSDEMAGYTM